MSAKYDSQYISMQQANMTHSYVPSLGHRMVHDSCQPRVQGSTLGTPHCNTTEDNKLNSEGETWTQSDKHI